MAGEDKRKGADRENTKKPKPLVKLNGKSDELYDVCRRKQKSEGCRQSARAAKDGFTFCCAA